MSNKTISIAQENKLFDGIDVSSYQGTIDFNRVKASGIDVVYIKAGEGGQITDPYFKQNYLKAARAGLIFGAYYYVTAKNTSEAKAQANDFFNLIRATSFNARPAMDFEDFSGMEREDINEIGLTFLEELERLTKITPMIYTNASSAETIWSDAFSKYPLWLADYSERDEFPPDITVWESWTGFQYSNTGTIPGISGNVDLNKFRDGILISLSDSDSSSEKDNTVEYMVRPGDTLWQIARRYETTVPAITALNGIADPDLIYIGQILRIPEMQR